MNTKRFIAQVIELIAPEKVATIKEQNRQRRAAMTALVRANIDYRNRGHNVEYINNHLHTALYFYNRGKYQDCVQCLPSEYAEQSTRLKI